MSGKDKILVDTNILIFLFEGRENAAKALMNKEIHFSFITEIELLGNLNVTTAQGRMITDMLSFHHKFGYTEEVGQTTIRIKRLKKIKVPDAIIAATAMVYDLPLLTSDKAFADIAGLNCILFEI
jgi:hypothetical protein